MNPEIHPNLKMPTSKLWTSRQVRLRMRSVEAGKLYRKKQECAVCGVWPFSTGLDDPFIACCEWHDSMYIAKENNALPADWDNRTKVDNQFFVQLMIVCANEQDEEKQRKLYERAALYVLIVSELGGLFW